jgi:type IV pilus biogenesis protein CpaD/CtpE
MFRPIPCIGVLLLLAGCAATDPYTREGIWRPNGANDANLRAMVVSPSDLVRGVGSTGGDGQQAAAALDRQRQDKPRVLPDSAIAKITPVASGGNGGGGGGN